MSDLAQELLDAARDAARRPERWLDRLSSEHLHAVEEARNSWLKTRHTSGISAARLAQAMIDRMTGLGYSMPSRKQVSRWITTGKSG